MFGYLAELMRRSNETFRVNTMQMYTVHESGILVDQLTAQRNGKCLDIELPLRVDVAAGRIVRGTDHFHQEHLRDEFWR